MKDVDVQFSSWPPQRYDFQSAHTSYSAWFIGFSQTLLSLFSVWSYRMFKILHLTLYSRFYRLWNTIFLHARNVRPVEIYRTICEKYWWKCNAWRNSEKMDEAVQWKKEGIWITMWGVKGLLSWTKESGWENSTRSSVPYFLIRFLIY